MSSATIDFHAIRIHGTSQNHGFEELTRQLVIADPPHGMSSMEHRGPGADGGVEILVNFPDGRAWGWQSKFFLNAFGRSEVAQLKASFAAALSNYPTLDRYYVAIPRNLSGEANGGRKTQASYWEGFRAWCVTQAARASRTIELVLWNESILISLLQRHNPRYEGMRAYWFNATFLDEAWFKRQVNKSIDRIGRRYRHDDHVTVAISGALDTLAETKGLRARVRDVAAGLKSIKERLEPLADPNVSGPTLAAGCRGARETACRGRQLLVDYLDGKIDRPSLINALELIGMANDRTGFLNGLLDEAFAMSPTSDRSTRNSHTQPAYRYDSRTRDLIGEIVFDGNAILQLFSARDMRLLRHQALLLDGEAGAGKSHLLARACLQHVGDGKPAIFIPAIALEQCRNPETAILQYLDLTGIAFSTFLGALQSAALSRGTKALIAIDGLNEADKPSHWQASLPALLADFRSLDRIALCLSIRHNYLSMCIRPGLDIQRVSHPGFSEGHGEAALRYLEQHGIDPSSAPDSDLGTIVYNPLFLTIAVDHLVSTGQTVFPQGLDSFIAIIRFWLEAIEANLIEKGYSRIALGDRSVEKAAQHLSARMAKNQGEYLDAGIAAEICEAVLGLGPPAERLDRFDSRLMDEGMLLDQPDRRMPSDKRVSFGFQKFSDYFIADAILKGCATKEALVAALSPGGRYAYLFSAPEGGSYSGVRSALLALVPMRFQVELPDLMPEIWRLSNAAWMDLVWSLSWRAAWAVTPATVTVLERGRIEMPDGSVGIDDGTWFDLLLDKASEPDCLLNARYLKRHLAGLTLGLRDATWSAALALSDHPILNDLIHQSWTAPASIKGVEKVRLIAILLSLTTSTTNRELRDTATKALSSLLITYPAQMPGLVAEFRDWDDAYVRERVLAAVAAGALYCDDVEIMSSTACAVDDMIFTRLPVERHAWTRRYGQIIVERAMIAGASLHEDLCSRSRPPYASEPISEWPTLRDVAPFERTAQQILHSVVGHMRDDPDAAYPMMAGDFGRYTMGTIGTSFSVAPRASIPDDELTARATRFWDRLEGIAPGITETRADILSICVGQSNEEEGILSASAATRTRANLLEEFEAFLTTLLDPDMLVEYHNVRSLDAEPATDPERISQLAAQCWVAARAVALGWDENLHELVEDRLMRGSAGRHDHEVERIGKKYQHIAHQELIGSLADHHWYFDWSGPPRVLQRLETYEHADIDPTYLAGDVSRAPEDFLPPDIRVPQMRFSGGDVAANAAWTSTLADIPDPEPYLMQTLPSGEGWSLLGLLSRSDGYMAATASAAPFRAAQFGVELLVFEAADVARLQDLSTETLAGDDSDIFDHGMSGSSFLGQLSHRFIADEERLELPYEVAGIRFGRLTQGFTAKHGDYDNSGIVRERTTLAPVDPMLKALCLSPRDAWSTVFVTEDGRPAFSDADGPAAQIVVVRSDIVEHFCNLNGLKPVWRVWVEKDGGGEGATTSGVFERHDYIGFYTCENGIWRGRMIPFRQPTR